MDSDKLLVRYKNETFDLTKFVKKHPGGRSTLNAVLNSDIDYKFETAMPHSPAAKYLLREYRVSSQTNNNDSKFDSELLNGGHVDSSSGKSDSNNIENSSTSNGYDRISGDRQMNGRDVIDHLIKTDESMEVNIMCCNTKVKENKSNQNPIKFAP